ncbi:MAG: hypothetical protein U0003_01325 [Vampirovibrionales bacterium]
MNVLRQSFGCWAVVALMVAITSSAQAFWPFGGDDDGSAAQLADKHPVVQPAPPDERIPKEECEPIRKKVVALRQAQGWWFNAVDEIRIASLTRKHRRCQDSFRDKEWEYLKHADPLPQAPVFPKGM